MVSLAEVIKVHNLTAVISMKKTNTITVSFTISTQPIVQSEVQFSSIIYIIIIFVWAISYIQSMSVRSFQFWISGSQEFVRVSVGAYLKFIYFQNHLLFWGSP